MSLQLEYLTNTTIKLLLKYFVWDTSNEKVRSYFHKALHLENKALLENKTLRLANIALRITCVNILNPKSSLNNVVLRTNLYYTDTNRLLGG